ncbi:MAG: hypothetical protein AB7F43_11250 [Bacteriovoracia bacterium]
MGTRKQFLSILGILLFVEGFFLGRAIFSRALYTSSFSVSLPVSASGSEELQQWQSYFETAELRRALRIPDGFYIQASSQEDESCKYGANCLKLTLFSSKPVELQSFQKVETSLIKVSSSLVEYANHASSILEPIFSWHTRKAVSEELGFSSLGIANAVTAQKWLTAIRAKIEDSRPTSGDDLINQLEKLDQLVVNAILSALRSEYRFLKFHHQLQDIQLKRIGNPTKFGRGLLQVQLKLLFFYAIFSGLFLLISKLGRTGLIRSLRSVLTLKRAGSFKLDIFLLAANKVNKNKNYSSQFLNALNNLDEQTLEEALKQNKPVKILISPKNIAAIQELSPWIQNIYLVVDKKVLSWGRIPTLFYQARQLKNKNSSVAIVVADESLYAGKSSVSPLDEKQNRNTQSPAQSVQLQA